MTPSDPSAGFTVIEALIAMAILAVAALALIGVSDAEVSRIDGLETRSIALWVAENRLAEIELAGPGKPGENEVVTMLGRNWSVATALAETADPDLERVTISVSEDRVAGTASVLSGFVDARPNQP